MRWIRSIRGTPAGLAVLAVAVLVGSAAACPFPANRWQEARLLPRHQTLPLGRMETVPGLSHDEEARVIWDDRLRRQRTSFRDVPPRGRDHDLARPIGRLDVAVRVNWSGERCISPCTAWLIDRDHLVTNYHCLHDPSGRDAFTAERAGLRLGYRSDLETGDFFPVDLPPVEEDRALDFAVLRVRGEPSATYGRVALGAGLPRPYDPLVVVGHPAGYRQQIVRDECYAAPQGPIVDGRLLHRCHSVGGNSGSPIFDAASRSVVALHSEGGFDGFGGFNKAIPITAIAQASRIVAEALGGGGGKPPGLIEVVGVYPRVGSVFKDCAECPEMVIVPRGSFLMGSPESEDGRDSDEGPQHRVTIDYGFAVGRYEVTFAEWEACVAAGDCGGHRPDDEGWGRGRRPVINVSWEDAQAYAAWLRRKTGQDYRLLSEAEWEFVARAGTRLSRFWGDDPADACRFANVHDRTSKEQNGFPWDHHDCTDGMAETAPVGRYRANAFGLFDVLGNVWEWVEDCRHGNYEGAPTDGAAWTTGSCSSRVLRGGSWYYEPRYVRSANRSRLRPDVRNDDAGFRLSRTF